MKLTLKDLGIIAVVLVLALGALLWGVITMLGAEPIAITGLDFAAYQEQVLPGLKQYSLVLGVVLVLVSIAYIILGRENDIETSLEKRE